ncbi:MAG: SAM-dependent DNA methyltransferase, partial [Euryarchaeota archaeon]|nr:SAM-dependent DNA methyltransferase [Euryarchaeota archaeon]
GDLVYKNRDDFLDVLDSNFKAAGVKIEAAVKKASLNALSEQDGTADSCMDKKGHPEPDADLRDYESVPLGRDVYKYFECEVRPHVPDAWVNEKVRDHNDGAVGRVGYEINFNRYFYRYQPPRPLEEIEADIRTLENEILNMLEEMV